MMKFRHVWCLACLALGRSLKTPSGAADLADRLATAQNGSDDALDLSSVLNEGADAGKSAFEDEDPVPDLPLEVTAPAAAAVAPAPTAETLTSKAETAMPDDDIQNLERSVLNLVNQGASPGMVTFVAEVRKLVHGKMKKELHLQHSATEKSLKASYVAIAGCSSRDWREMLNVALSHDVNGSFTLETYKLPELAEEHRNCRDVEAERTGRVADLQSMADFFMANAAYACGLYAGNESHRLLPVGDSNRCIMDVEKYPVSSRTRHLDYLKDQLAFWDAEYQKIVDSRVQCTSNTKAYEKHQVLVNQAKTALADVRQACNEAQAKMDEASCGYKASVTKKCELIARCQESTWKTYNETLTTARTEEIFLKAQMSTLERIECYLGAFELSNMTEGILQCKDKDFQHHEEVNKMLFRAEAKPEPSECEMDKENVAGYCAYEGKYYANTSNLSQPCNASCCSASCHP